VFIRFVVSELDRMSGRRQGLFQAAKRLKESENLELRDRAQLERLAAWFNENLEKPSRLAMSPRPHRKAQAISWFRDSATAHIAKMREIEEVVGRYGAAVQFIKARRVGYVVYEDQFQIVACPFGDTPA
jgi:hypothetical protein